MKCHNRFKKPCALLVALMLMIPAAYSGTDSGTSITSVSDLGYVAKAETVDVPGYIYKQGLVLDDNGNPSFAEYDPATGNTVKLLDQFDAASGKLLVASGEAYANTREQLLNWRDNLLQGEFEHYTIVTPEEYQSLDYPSAFQQYVHEPFSSSKSLLVYKPSALNGTVQLDEDSGLIVFQSKFNIAQLLLPDQTLVVPGVQQKPSESRSLLVDENGDLKYLSEDNNIGLRVAFFDGLDQSIERSQSGIHAVDMSENSEGEKTNILAPIQGARIWDGLSHTISGVSDKNGQFINRVRGFVCPGITVLLSIPVTAEIPYRSFNPQKADTFNHHFYSSMYGYGCVGLAPIFPTNQVEGGAYMAAAAILGTVAAPVQRIGIAVDLTLLTGTFSISNGVDQPIIPVNNATKRLTNLTTQYRYVDPRDQKVKPDFNNDGEDDHVSRLGSIPLPEGAPADAPPLYGVWFSGVPEHHTDDFVPLTDSIENGGEIIPPDLVRVAVQEQNFDDIGLLESISEEDLSHTDLYVFRQSTGELVVEKSPFYLIDTRDTVDEETNNINGIIPTNLGAETPQPGGGFYEVAIPGQADLGDARYFSGGGDIAGELENPDNKGIRYNAWQATQFVEKDFRGDTDSLRVGEPLQIVLINRATGYVGVGESSVERVDGGNANSSYGYAGAQEAEDIAADLKSGNSSLAIVLDDIVLYPPNLKISVERQYQVEQGLTQGETRRYNVGSEGAALHSDQLVKVTTDWRAVDGTPLPTDLPGMTGRLVSLVADQTLGDSSINHFGIEPGLNTEVIKLNNLADVQSTGYQYLHVVGEQDIDAADFGTSDATHNRPEKYVPVRVAVYDEAKSRALKQAQLENPPSSGENTVKQDSSVYQWPYRPEMMYSVFELDVKQITRTPAGEDSEAIDITESETPTIAAGDTDLSIVQDLIASEYDPLEYFGPDSHLVYSLEGYQQQVNVGTDQTYSFSEFGHLGELNGEDFLTLNLLNSQDAGNVLWEWAFEYLTLSLANDEEIFFDNRVYISADSATIELAATLIGYANRADSSGSVLLDWKVEQGDAEITPDARIFPETGVLRATIEPAPLVENLVVVSAYLHESPDTKVLSIEIAIQAGEVASIRQHSGEGTAYVRGKGQHNVVSILTDQHGNLVSDGTPVGVKVRGTARVIEKQSATVDGLASFAIKGTSQSGTVQVRVRSNGIEENYPVSIQSLKTEVIGMPASFALGVTYSGVVKVSNSAGAPQSGVPIELYAVGADVVLKQKISDQNGEIAFEARVNEFASVSRVIIDANADGRLANQKEFSIGAASNSEAVQFDVLAVGTSGKDSLLADLIDIDSGSGDQCTIDLSEPSFTIRGSAQAEVPAVVSSLHYPNLMPLVASNIFSGTARSVAALEVTKSAVLSDSDTPTLQGFSARFATDAQWEIAPSAALRVQQPAISFWYKPATVSNSGNRQILSFGNGALVLSSNAEGHLSLKVKTMDSADTEVTKELVSPVVLNTEWYRVAMGYKGDHFYLLINDDRVELPWDSALSLSSSTVGLALGGFDGMKLSNLSVFDHSSTELVAVNASESNFDSNGEAKLSLARSTVLNQETYAFEGQRIDWHYQGGRLTALLQEDEALKTYASMFTKSRATPCTPLHLTDIAGVLAEYMPPVRAMAKRHADIKVADADSAVELAKAGLRWIEFHPNNRGTAPAMRRLQSYLRSPEHNVLASLMDEEFSTAIEEEKQGFELRMLTLLTGLQVWSEMIDANPVAAGLLVDNVQSSADFWTWMRFLSLPGKGWSGDVIPMPKPYDVCNNWSATINAGNDYAYNPKPCRVSGLAAGLTVADISTADPDDNKNITQLLSAINYGLRGADLLVTKMVFDDPDKTASLQDFNLIKSANANPLVTRTISSLIKAIIKVAGSEGAENIIRYIKNESNSRFDSKTVLASIAYLETRKNDSSYPCTGNCKTLAKPDQSRVEKNISNNTKRFMLGVGLAKYGDILDEEIKGRKMCLLTNQAHGAAMELVLTTMYHALYESGHDKYEILTADEPVEVAYVASTGWFSGEPVIAKYGRKPDLILAGEGTDENDIGRRYWIEAKSWKEGKNDVKKNRLSGISKWKWNSKAKPGKYNGAHKQFIFDSIATDRTSDFTDDYWLDRLETPEYIPAAHKTWIQVWDQENRDYTYYKKNKVTNRYEKMTGQLTLARSWIDLKNGKKLTTIGAKFPLLQDYLTTIPSGLGDDETQEMLELDADSYGLALRSRSYDRLDGQIAPFTLWFGLKSEVGEGAARAIIGALKNELDNQEFFGDLDPDKLTPEQKAQLQAKVIEELEKLLGPIKTALDAIREVEDALLPEYIKDLLDKIDIAVEEAVEGAGGEAIREVVANFEVPESFASDICETD